MAESVEARALKIAAKCLVSAGACRHDDISDCWNSDPKPLDCQYCIEGWLMDKARKELGSK